MKKLCLMFLCLLNLYGLKANPWDLDQETKDLFTSQLNSSYQKHIDKAIKEGKTFYLIDFERRILNFYDNTCSYCQDLKKPTLFHFEEKLRQSHFIKKTPTKPKAHCWGTTLFFVEQLISHPELLTSSCADILSEISNAPDFEEKVHSFSMNQHPYYSFQSSNTPLELHPDAMKLFFQVLLEKSPSSYFFLPLSVDKAQIDPVSIYATLKSLPNQLIIVGYCNESANNIGNHCIVISTHSKKLFVFDSNLGIYHFPDLETLSQDTGNVLKGKRFRWLAAFPIGKDS